jgi:radical SAM-linked protein
MLENREEARGKRLELLGGLPGVLVPGLRDYRAEPVKRRVYRGGSPDPERPVVPNMRISQDRGVVELSRGCPNLCRFCHAGYYELPCRENGPDELKERVLGIIESTGYEEVTLSALSVSDYTLLPELLNRILPELTRRGVSLSLPSLRVDPSTLPVIEAISDVRKTSLTFAVESASEHIRRLANKRLVLEEMYDMVERLFSRGWKVIKFYFMLGLPGFRDVDEVDDILAFLREVRNRTGRRGEVHVTLSPFVPKPHTPFQAEEMADYHYLVESIGRVRREAPRGIKVRFHDVSSSRLECVLGRGGERLSPVIEEVYRRGARLDSWREHFNREIWEEVLDSEMPQWQGLTGPLEGELPWQVVDPGWEELRKGQEREMEKGMIRKPAPASLRWKSGIHLDELERARSDFEKRYRVQSRILLRFTKEADLRFLSHLDYAEVILRALRMAGVPVSFSQGYNKRERVSFGFPVPLGVASLSELCEVLCYEPWQADYDRVNRSLPPGARLLAAEKVEGGDSLMGRIGSVEYSVYGGSGLADTIRRALDEGRAMEKRTKKGVRRVALKEALSWLRQDGEVLYLGLFSGTPESLRIDRLLEQLSVPGTGPITGAVKTGQYERRENNWRSLDPEP